jgi:hypothetical protein
VHADTKRRGTMGKIFRSTKSGEPSAAPVNGFSEQSIDPTLLEPDSGPRELAHRSDGGLEVTLLWHPARDELTVCGSDHRTGARFELRAEHHSALEVYYHPYCYVTSRDISYDDHRLVEPATYAGA